MTRTWTGTLSSLERVKENRNNSFVQRHRSMVDQDTSIKSNVSCLLIPWLLILTFSDQSGDYEPHSEDEGYDSYETNVGHEYQRRPRNIAVQE